MFLTLALNLFALNKRKKIVKISHFEFHFFFWIFGFSRSCRCWRTRRLWVYVCLMLSRNIFEHTHTQTDNWEKTRELSQANLTALPCSLTVLLSWDWQAACRRLASNHNKRTKKSKKSLKNQEFQKKFDNVLKSLCISIRKEDLQSSHDIGFEEPEFGQVSVSLFKRTCLLNMYGTY